MRRYAEESAPALLLLFRVQPENNNYLEFRTTPGVSEAGLIRFSLEIPFPQIWEPNSTRTGVWLGREHRKLAKCKYSTCELEEHRTVRILVAYQEHSLKQDLCTYTAQHTRWW